MSCKGKLLFLPESHLINYKLLFKFASQSLENPKFMQIRNTLITQNTWKNRISTLNGLP